MTVLLAQADMEPDFAIANIVIGLAVTVAGVVMCFLKDKPFLGLAGLLFPPLAWIGAIRLARPGSWWARLHYGPEEMRRSIQRYTHPEALPDGVTLAGPWRRLGSWALELALFFVTFGVGWLIWGAFTGPTGQTPAKSLLDLRVIRRDTWRPVGMWWMLLRGVAITAVSVALIVVTLGVVLLLPFLDRRRQNIWDLISDCYVVHDPNDAWKTRHHASQLEGASVTPVDEADRTGQLVGTH